NRHGETGVSQAALEQFEQRGFVVERAQQLAHLAAIGKLRLLERLQTALDVQLGTPDGVGDRLAECERIMHEAIVVRSLLAQLRLDPSSRLVERASFERLVEVA